jgi:hypothetical protein
MLPDRVYDCTMADPVSDYEILKDMVKFNQGLLRFIAKMSIEHSLLLACLAKKGYLTTDELKQLYREVEERMKPMLEDADAERLLDLLRKFEGPPQ